jgi:hypothetical protein
VLICGKNLLKENEWKSLGVEGLIALSDRGHSDSYCMQNAKQLIEKEIADYLKTKEI